MSNVQEAYIEVYGVSPNTNINGAMNYYDFKRGYEAALSEIEKCEPVAWMDETNRTCNALSKKCSIGFADGLFDTYNIPLYTSPQPIEKCEPVIGLENGQILWSKMPSEYTGSLYTSPQPRELYAGDYVAYLYKDNNGVLKICNESPPSDKAFPVFKTNLSFLDVARTVLDDCSDLIIKHGSVNLWKELVAKINRDYKQLNTKG